MKPSLMVWDPPNKPVNVTRMIIYSLIPILSIYAGWRIQKFWLLFIVNFVVGTVTAYLVGWYGIFVSVPISVFLVWHYANKYNERFAATSPPSECLNNPIATAINDS